MTAEKSPDLSWCFGLGGAEEGLQGSFRGRRESMAFVAAASKHLTLLHKRQAQV